MNIVYPDTYAAYLQSAPSSIGHRIIVFQITPDTPVWHYSQPPTPVPAAAIPYFMCLSSGHKQAYSVLSEKLRETA
jgi:hypothetical protein